MKYDYQKSLLAEYDACDRQIERLDAQIWQMGSVILPLSLAGLGYFGLSTNHSPDLFFILLAVGMGSITLILSWGILAHTRHSYRYIALHRIREIETELGLWHYKYTRFIGKSKKQQKAILDSMKNDQDQRERFQRLADKNEKTIRIGFRSLTFIVTTVLVAGWVSLIVREYILSF